MFKGKKLFLLSCLLSTFSAYANTTSEHIVVVPKCLIEKSSATYQTLSTSKNLLLIKTNTVGIDQLSNLKHGQKKICGGFIDVTADWNSLSQKKRIISDENKTFLSSFEMQPKISKLNKQAEYKINYPKEVTAIINTVNPQDMWSNLETLTQFHNRHANSEYGVNAAKWVETNILETARKHGHTSLMDNDFTVYTVKTGDKYQQPSVVAKFGKGDGPAVVIGAHIDTVGGRAPGADDDGSGSATLFEAAKTLLASGMHFENPIYFIWYAAEEQGLVGSGYVVKHFQKEKIPVAAVMHLDLTAYANKKDLTMWLTTDYTNKELTSYLEKLITTYVKRDAKTTTCGYACSDHASWYRAGYIAGRPTETDHDFINPYIHSTSDTMDKLSLEHMTNFAKLSVAFAIELGKPVKT